MVDGDIENGAIMEGQNVAMLTEIKPCLQIMDEIISEAREVITNLFKVEI